MWLLRRAAPNAAASQFVVHLCVVQSVLSLLCIYNTLVHVNDVTLQLGVLSTLLSTCLSQHLPHVIHLHVKLCFDELHSVCQLQVGVSLDVSLPLPESTDGCLPQMER